MLYRSAAKRLPLLSDAVQPSPTAGFVVFSPALRHFSLGVYLVLQCCRASITARDQAIPCAEAVHRNVSLPIQSYRIFPRVILKYEALWQ